MAATFKYASNGNPEINGVAVPYLKSFTMKAGGESGPYVEVELRTGFLTADIDTTVGELVIVMPDGKRYKFTGVEEV